MSDPHHRQELARRIDQWFEHYGTGARQELANRARVSPSTIDRARRAETNVQPGNLQRITAALDRPNAPNTARETPAPYAYSRIINIPDGGTLESAILHARRTRDDRLYKRLQKFRERLEDVLGEIEILESEFAEILPRIETAHDEPHNGLK